VPDESDGQSPYRRWGEHVPFWMYSTFLLVVALTGGASRSDSFAQTAVRVGAIAFLAAIAMMRRPVEWRSLRWPIAYLAVLAAVMVVMLVPLPPSIWTDLPGRALIAKAAPLAGMPQPWRPLAISPPLALNALMALIPALAAMLGMLFLTPVERGRLLTPIVVLILVSAVLGLAQVSAGQGSGLRWYAITNRAAGVGFFANRNHQALFLALGLPALAIWATTSAVRFPSVQTRTWLAGGIAIFLCLTIPTTGSRAGLLLGAVGLVAAAALSAGRIRAALRKLSPRWRAISVGAGAAVVVLIFVVALTFRSATSVQRLFSLDVGSDTRTLALPTLKQLIVTYFPAGTGFGGFEPAFRAAEPFGLLRTTYLNEAHNDVVQLVIEGGLAGALLLVAFVSWWLYRSVVIWRMSTAVTHARLARAASVMVLMTMLASVADYPLRTPLIMVTMVVACVWMQLPRDKATA